MKFIYSIVLSTCLFLVNFAQAPQGLNYQGVARNNAGVELPNQNIGIQLSILDGSVSGAVLYTETHALTTDANGLFTLVIGFGTPVSGTFSAVNWAVGGSKWLKVSMDAAGGSNYQLMGTSQLLSVPYALFAGNVANNGGKQTLVLSDNVTDSQAAAIIAAEVGPNTQEIRIVGTTNLTTVNLSMITTAIDIQVSNNSALTTLNLSGLTRCDGQLSISNCPALTNLNLTALTKITTIGLYIDNTGLSSINLNTLTKCNGEMTIEDNLNLTAVNLSALTTVYGIRFDSNPLLPSIILPSLVSNTEGLSIGGNSQLTSISFPILISSTYVIINNNNTLTNISLPLLSNTNGISINNNTSLSSFSMPVVNLNSINVQGNTNLNTFSMLSLVNVISIYVQGNTNLNTLNFPALTSAGGFSISNNAIINNPFTALTSITSGSGGNNFSLSSNKLSVSAVDSILAKLVNVSPTLTGKTIQLNNQTPLAPPSGPGIIDKAALITNGNTVYTD
jgi:hypothetical protein